MADHAAFQVDVKVLVNLDAEEGTNEEAVEIVKQALLAGDQRMFMACATHQTTFLFER